MNKTELQQHIIKEIQEIYSFVNRFEQNNPVHQIDIDLALSKVRNLYDLLLKLNAQGLYQSEYQKEEKSTIHKPVEKPHEIKEVEVIQKEEPRQVLKAQVEDVQPDPVIIVEKKEPKKEQAKPVEPKKEVIIIEEKPKKETSKAQKQDSGTEIIADKFQSKTFMHDNIAKDKADKMDVSKKFKSKPINDINAAIGLNDKHVFIRELFEGDKNQYTETIQVLNNFDTFGNALNFLKENFDWDFENPTVEKLVDLVQRKYNI